jgi:fatty acid desaturase
MASNDKKHQFDQIVDGLKADYPSLAGRRARPRWVLVTAAVTAGLIWALLSVAMVVWGAVGVALTCAAVAAAAAVLYWDSHRRA